MMILGLVPGLLSAYTAWVGKSTDAQLQMYMAKTGASKEVAVAALQAQATVQTKWWWAALPPAVIGMVYAVYQVKAVFWDKVVGSFVGCSGHPAPGTCISFATDGLGADFHWAFVTVMLCYFGVVVADKWFGSR